ncbi:MAG: hypothetical protein HYU63_05500 [Armatimonadetes bacterium]|nr:hypothetical protein [Armatimonadota bacterium]
MRDFNEIIKKAKKFKNFKIVLVEAKDAETLKAVSQAKKIGLASPILIGKAQEIKNLLYNLNLKENFEIINALTQEEAVIKAIELIKNNQAQIIMKGKIKTNQLMKIILDKEKGLPKAGILSHILVFKLKKINSLILLSDGGMLINPNLEEKIELIKNTIAAARALKISPLKIALLCASYKLNILDDVSSSAYFLKKTFTNEKNLEFLGPLSFDRALENKANILIAPDIETGNILGKSLMYFCEAESALIIMGAYVPIVVTSRADQSETKLNSLALALVAADYLKKEKI